MSAAVCVIGGIIALLLFLIAIEALPSYLEWKKKPSEGPACAECGYLVIGLPESTTTCPECGSDLGKTGVIKPREKKHGLPARIALWSAILPFPAMVGSCIVGDICIPEVHTTTETILLHTPKSRAYVSVELAGTGHVVLRSPKPPKPRTPMIPLEQVTLTLKPLPDQGRTTEMKVDLGALSYRYADKAGRVVEQRQGLNSQIIADWLASAGIDTSRPHVKSEAKQIWKTVKKAQDGRVFFWFSVLPGLGSFKSSGSMSGDSRFPYWYTFGSILLWVSLWWGGVMFFRNQARRQTVNIATPSSDQPNRFPVKDDYEPVKVGGKYLLPRNYMKSAIGGGFFIGVYWVYMIITGCLRYRDMYAEKNLEPPFLTELVINNPWIPIVSSLVVLAYGIVTARVAMKRSLLITSGVIVVFIFVLNVICLLSVDDITLDIIRRG